MEHYSELSKLLDADIATLVATEIGGSLISGTRENAIVSEVVSRLVRANGGECP